MIEKKKLSTRLAITEIIVGLIVLVDVLFFRDVRNIFSSVLIVAGIISFLPIALFKYYENWKVRQLEDVFPQFMHDLVESVRSGMTLPQAIDLISKNDYGDLTPLVKKLNAQLNWGIPFEKAFKNFAKNTKSKLISRISSTILESHKFGGNLTDIFEAISETSVTVERLREERKLYMNSQILTGYVIFFIFLIVIIALQKFFIPSLTTVSAGEVVSKVPEEIVTEYKIMFRNMILLHGFFAGLVIGKMAEGVVEAGIKHSFILMVIGFVTYTVVSTFI